MATTQRTRDKKEKCVDTAENEAFFFLLQLDRICFEHIGTFTGRRDFCLDKMKTNWKYQFGFRILLATKEIGHFIKSKQTFLFFNRNHERSIFELDHTILSARNLIGILLKIWIRGESIIELKRKINLLIVRQTLDLNIYWILILFIWAKESDLE